MSIKPACLASPKSQSNSMVQLLLASTPPVPLPPNSALLCCARLGVQPDAVAQLRWGGPKELIHFSTLSVHRKSGCVADTLQRVAHVVHLRNHEQVLRMLHAWWHRRMLRSVFLAALSISRMHEETSGHHWHARSELMSDRESSRHSTSNMQCLLPSESWDCTCYMRHTHLSGELVEVWEEFVAVSAPRAAVIHYHLVQTQGKQNSESLLTGASEAYSARQQLHTDLSSPSKRSDRSSSSVRAARQVLPTSVPRAFLPASCTCTVVMCGQRLYA